MKSFYWIIKSFFYWFCIRIIPISIFWTKFVSKIKWIGKIVIILCLFIVLEGNFFLQDWRGHKGNWHTDTLTHTHTHTRRITQYTHHTAHSTLHYTTHHTIYHPTPHTTHHTPHTTHHTPHTTHISPHTAHHTPHTAHSFTMPDPLQVVQTWGVLPDALPDPAHDLQCVLDRTVMVFFVLSTASMNLSVSVVCRSFPRRGRVEAPRWPRCPSPPNPPNPVTERERARLFRCIYTYIYERDYLDAYIYIYIYIYIYRERERLERLDRLDRWMHTYIHIYTYIYTYYIYIYIYIYRERESLSVYVYVYMCAFMCMCFYLCRRRTARKYSQHLKTQNPDPLLQENLISAHIIFPWRT